MGEADFEKSKFSEASKEHASPDASIEYSHKFPDGELFEAKEQPDGTVQIQIAIKSGDRRPFDLAELLPEGYHFVSYSYVERLEQKHAKKFLGLGGWRCLNGSIYRLAGLVLK